MATLKMIETQVPEVGDTAVVDSKPVEVSYILSTGVEDLLLFSNGTYMSQGEFLQYFYFDSSEEGNCWKPLD